MSNARTAEYLYQKLSLDIQRGNAVAVMRTQTRTATRHSRAVRESANSSTRVRKLEVLQKQNVETSPLVTQDLTSTVR